MNRELTLQVEQDKEFVETPYIKEITERSLHYIQAGFPVHFRGPAGTGKSTLAKHIASKLNRPTCLLHGDEELTSSTLVGGESGYRFKRVRDNFISTVLKEEEEMTKGWVDNQLTEACRHGYTLIYDEFTRSRPEANNVLLSVLQDRILTLTNDAHTGNPYLQVHPDFVALFTSNPEEYAGTHKSQDALRDRMVTIDLQFPDYETELGIVYAKSRIPMDICELITNIIRQLRDSELCDFSPTIRSGIMIAKTITVTGIEPEEDVKLFTTYCQDILSSETGRLTGGQNQQERKDLIENLVINHINKTKRSHFIAV
ncbi:MAG: gas vesicle protein GvpN [Bacteroidota bacterium]